jgi:hypothetical protein
MKNLKKTINELRNLNNISFYRQPVVDALEMVTEDIEEQKAIIVNTFFYLHTMYSDSPSYDGFFETLEPTIENLVAVFYAVNSVDFIHAWTFAIHTVLRTKISKESKSSNLDHFYIG